MEVSVSIIMPVYNGEKYLNQAIDSILAQEEKEWELIIVDDGSFDSTAEIVEVYASKDSRIKVYHQSNQGVSASRQFGIDHAIGKYCIHVDADDWVEPNYLSALLKKAEETDADMVWCDWYVNESGKWTQSCEENPTAIIRSFLSQKTWGSLTNRLTKTSIYQNPEVQFVPNSSMWEDMSFLVQCLCFCNSVIYVPRSLYHYRMNESSLTHSQNHKDISAEYRRVIDYLADFLNKHGRLEEFRYEIRGLQLFAIRDFIDDLRYRDYGKFMNTYPEAIAHIHEYKKYPRRLKICAWLLQHQFPVAVPFVCKIDGVFRRLGLSSQI